MATVIQVESTEYVYIGVTGTVPSVSAEMAFLTAGARPTSTDWETATIVPDDADPLWADAQASGAVGDYFVARLIGSYNANDVVLSAGDYQVWLRLTDSSEQPVRIAPVTLEVQG